MAGASIHLPLWVRIDRPGTSLGASKVRKLVSVCGAMPNSSIRRPFLRRVVGHAQLVLAVRERVSK